VDSSWTADHFAPTSSVAGSTLLAEGVGLNGAAVVSGGRVVLSRGGDGVGKSYGGRLSAARPDVYPANLLSDGSEGQCAADHLGEGRSGAGSETVSHSWWLAHTLPRQEKSLAAALYARGVSYYLPLVTRKSLSRGRTRVAQVTLFPGYLFVCGNEEDRLSVLRTKRVLTVRPAPDGDRLRSDLRRFYELITLGAPLLPEARLIAGQRVRVKAGPFRDQEGVVIRRNGKTRLLISIDYLQQGASLEVDDCLLERV
jgi:transcription antitermination factor NusG